MVHKSNLLASLTCAPDYWRYTPTHYKDAFVDDWPNNPFTLDKVLEKNPTYTTGIGLILNEVTETFSVDLDGIGSARNFEHHFGKKVSELPPTICNTSGRPDRCQMFFKIPKKYWKFVKYQELTLESCSTIEIRWGNYQSVLVGKHPNKFNDGQGFYCFVNKKSPKDVELATAPEWFLDKWCELTTKVNKKKNNTSWLKKETKKELENDSARVKPFLKKYYQPADKYSHYFDWLYVGMSLHHVGATLGDEFRHFDDWLEWSSQMHNFKEKECYTKWRSFGKAERPRKFGSFYDTAKKNNPETFNEEPPKEKTLTKEDKVKKIAETIDEIYKLEIEGGNWNKIAYLKSVLGGYFIRKEEVQDRLLMMFAERNGLSFADKKNTKRRHRTFSSTMSKEEEMNVLQPGFTIQGKDCVLMGQSGAGKTLGALGLSYALATGAPILDDLYGIPESKHGATLWIGSDGGDGAFGMIKKYSEMLNVPHKSVWEDNFTFWGADAEEGVSSWAFTLKGLSELVEELEAGHVNGSPYKYLFVDSLKKVLELGNIDYGVGPVGKVMQIAQAIASKYDCTWIWLHHISKGASKGDYGIASSGGNSNIFQIPFVVHRLVKHEHKELGQITEWIVEKFRGEKTRKFKYVLTESLFELVDDEVADTDDKNVQIMRHIFKGQDYEGTNHKIATPEDIANKIQMNIKTLRNRLGILKKQKYLTSKSGVYSLSKLGAKYLAIECPSIREQVNDYMNEQWGVRV